MKLNLEGWKEASKNGTSGDMVDDILQDWEEDRSKLLEKVNFFESNYSRLLEQLEK